MGGIVSATFLLLCSSSFASNTAPNVQVVVKKGFSTVFKGITDGTGKFSTPALEPGPYRFELRAPKTVTPARYFLSLAGARPIGQTMTNPGGDLVMEAEV